MSRRGSRDNLLLEQDLNFESVSFEEEVVARQQRIINRKQGRSIKSVLKSPSYGYTDGSHKRGVTFITNNIILGGRDDASDLSLMNELGVTHILNVAQQLPNYHEPNFCYLKIPLIDTTEANITNCLALSSNFIKRVEDMNGRVLVHCISGVSRSTSVLIMHLMNRYKMTLCDAYEYIRSCRPFISPNDGFKLQLANLELQQCGASSVTNTKAWSFYAWNNKKQTVPIRKKSKRSGSGDGEDDETDCIDVIISLSLSREIKLCLQLSIFIGV